MRGLWFREVQWLDRGPTAGQWLRQDQSPGPRARCPGLRPCAHIAGQELQGGGPSLGLTAGGVSSGLGVMLSSTHRH